MHQSAVLATVELEPNYEKSQGTLLEEIYDRLFRLLGEGHQHLQLGEIELARERLRRAARVLGGLKASLNVGHSLEVSRDLDYLYSFCLDSLTRACRECDAECVLDVMRILKPLREAWALANLFEERMAG